MALLGSLGLGLVWGWWLVLIGRTGWPRPLRSLFTLIFPTLLLLVLLWSMADGVTAVLFLAAVIVSLFIHLAWRQKLAQAF